MKIAFAVCVLAYVAVATGLGTFFIVQVFRRKITWREPHVTNPGNLNRGDDAFRGDEA